MRRFPRLPFLLSALLTAGITAVVWHHRGQTLTVSSPQHPVIARVAALPAVMEVPAAFRDGVDSTTEMALLDALDAEACAAMVSRLPGTDGLLLLRWVELDCTACAAWLYSLPPGPQRKAAAGVILGWWTGTDPRAAQQCFISRTGHRPREVMNGSQALRDQWGDLASHLVEGDYRKPREIIASIRALRAENVPDADRKSQLSSLDREWEAAVEKGHFGGEAAELIESITDTPRDPLAEWAENQKPALQRALFPRAPLTTMAWLQKHPDDNWGYELLYGTLNGLLRGAASAYPPGETPALTEPWPEPEEIARWFLSIPRAKDKRAPIEVLTDFWAKVDVNAAGAWLNKQPDSEATDAGRAVMADAAVKEDPRAAMAWAQSINDEARRQKSIESVLHLWRTFDPVEAAAHVSGATSEPPSGQGNP